MTNTNKKITIFLYVSVIQKWYECQVSNNRSFRSIIEELKNHISEEDKWKYDFNGDIRVYEFTQNIECDLDVSLISMKVINGMSFVIY